MLVNSPTQILFSKIYPAGPQVVPGGRTNERKDEQTKLVITFCMLRMQQTKRSSIMCTELIYCLLPTQCPFFLRML